MAATGLCANGADMTLVRDGKALTQIVYATNAEGRGKTRFLASVEDFRRIVKLISGAEMEAVAAADGGEIANTIQIGLTPAAKAAGLDQRTAKLKRHSLLIQVDPAKKVMYLLGSTPEGSGHAIYEFLESLGCRWYMPGPFGEALPTLASIAVPATDRVREPEFELRAVQLRAKGTGGDKKIRGEVMDWMRRSKFGGSGPSRGHAFPKLIPTAKYWETHPEYYSLRQGKRQAKHLCMTNPEVLDAAEATLTEFFTKNPKAGGFPVALADGAQYCECPPCTKACGGNARDIMPLYLSFTKALFDRIDRKFPGRQFQYGFYVYSNLMEVPKGMIPKQLAPYIAPLGYDAFHTSADPERYLALSVASDFPKSTISRIKADPRSDPARLVQKVIKGWSSGTDNIYFRDYDPYVTFAQNMPLVRTYQLAIEIPWHKEIGVRGYTPEATANSWFTSGVNFWVRSRFYWDVKGDIKEVMQDYCQGMFGAAWEPMYGFLDALARRTIESPAFRHGDHVFTRLYSIDWVNGLDFYLVEAEKRAATEREKAGVQMWRLCQQHMLKYLNMRQAEIRADFDDAASLGDDYLRFLDYISTVNPHFVDHRWYAEREFSMQTMVPKYRQYAAKLNGEEGRLLATLPQQWWFRHDPKDVGRTEGWQKFDPIPTYEPPKGLEVDVKRQTMPGWRLQSTEESWQRADEDYAGYNWYRTQIRLPAGLEAEKVHMFVTGIFGHMDFFVNGKQVTWRAKVGDQEQEVGHLDLGSAWSWNYNESFSVPLGRYLRPGEVNTIVCRTRDMRHWGGIFKRAQLYTPLVEPPPPKHPAKVCDCTR